MFGIDPTAMALRPSTVLQNIINEKQLAAQEKARATNEKLALKRIAQTEAAQAEQSRQFDVSQDSRGDMSDYQTWLKDNWGKMTPQQQAAEARKVAAENRKQEIYEREKTQAQAIDKWGQPTVQPTTQPIPQQVVAPTEQTPPKQGIMEIITPKQDQWKGFPYPMTETATQPAPTTAKSKTYTPPKDITSVFETNPNRQQDFQRLYDKTQKLTIAQEWKIVENSKQEILSERPNEKRLSVLNRASKIRARKYQKIAENERQKAISDIRKEENLIREDLKPKSLTYAQKTKIKSIKTDLKQGSYLSKDILRGKLKTNKIESLNDAIGYIAFKGESPDKFTKELEKYARIEYNKLRASGVSIEEARKRLGI